MMPFDTIAVANKLLGTSYTKRELLDICYTEQARLKQQWLTSNRKDFKVYDDPGYLLDCILSYSCVSQRCLINGERFFRAHNIPKGKALDIFNGIGLSTLHANLVGFDCEALSASDGQADLCQQLSKQVLGRPTVIHRDLKSLKPASFDVLFSFEVLEHFQDPVQHLNEVLPLLKPGGHFVESTGFKSPDHIGHFERYTVGNEQVLGRQASTAVRKRLEQEATKVMIGFDKKPRIWVKTLQPKPKTMFRGIHSEMLALGLEPFYKG